MLAVWPLQQGGWSCNVDTLTSFILRRWVCVSFFRCRASFCVSYQPAVCKALVLVPPPRWLAYNCWLNGGWKTSLSTIQVTIRHHIKISPRPSQELLYNTQGISIFPWNWQLCQNLSISELSQKPAENCIALCCLSNICSNPHLYTLTQMNYYGNSMIHDW